MSEDSGSLAPLLEESNDLHTDAMAHVRATLDEITEVELTEANSDPTENQEFADSHRHSLQASLGKGALAAAGGGLLVAMLASPAYASSSAEVQILQTAASIEALAVATYKTALTLPYIGGSSANKIITAFATTTMGQHEEHLKAFNSALKSMHAKTQKKPNPAFVPVVNSAVKQIVAAGSGGALDVVALALELENVAAETYTTDVAKLKKHSHRALMASIMGVEAQHVSVLLAVQALLKAGAPQLIALSPTNVASLPGVAGSVGFPNAFYPTSAAAPAKSGAVK